MALMLRTKLAAVAALGGLATVATAQYPVTPAADKPCPTPVAAAGKPQVVRWPGGYMLMNGPEVIVRHAGVPEVRAGSTNIVTGSGNGFGNTIVVDGGRPGVTVVKNARNGIGNRLIVDPDDLFLDLDDLGPNLPKVPCKPAPTDPVTPPKPAPAVLPADPMIEPPAPTPEPPAVPVKAAAPTYKGKANPFWSKKAWSDAHDCNLYWSAADRAWFRYASEDDTYRPVVGGPDEPVGGM